MFPVRVCVVVFICFFAARATAQLSYHYEWGHPSPQGNTVHGFSFADSLTGWAVAGNGFVLRTTDGGLDWKIQRYPEQDMRHIYDVQHLTSGTLIAAGAQDALIRSTNGGEDWQPIEHPFAGDLRDLALRPDGGITAAGESGVVLLSMDDGLSWQDIGPGGNGDARFHLWRSKTEGFVVGPGGLFSRTTNGGMSWLSIEHQSTFGINEIVFTCPDTALAFDDFNVWRSVDSGATWSDWSESHPPPYHFRTLAYSSQHLLAVNFGEGGEIVESTDGGRNWQYLSFRFVVGYPCLYRAPGGRVFMGSDAGDLYYSDDEGHTITNSASNLTSAVGASIMCFGRRPDGVLFAANQPSMFQEVQSWMRSDNGGVIWLVPDSSPGLRWVSDIMFFDNSIGVACSYEQIRHTTNGGVTWGASSLPANYYTTQLATPASDRFYVATYVAGADAGGLFKSADSGRTWQMVGNGLPSAGFRAFGVRFADNLTGSVFGTVNSSPVLYKTENGGGSWSLLPTTGLPGVPRDMAWLDANTAIATVYMFDNFGIFRTTDGGTSWYQVSPEAVLKLEFQNSLWGIALGSTEGLIETTDGGLTWQTLHVPIGGGLGTFYESHVSAVAPGTDGWVLGGAQNKILVAHSVLTVVPGSTERPRRMVVQISGAFPNPFNPSTTVHFRLSHRARVRVSVYNILGQQVRRLSDEESSVGENEVVWDGRDDRGRSVGSGVYLVRVKAAGSEDVMKIMFVK